MARPVVGITACRSDLRGRYHHIVQEKYVTAVSAAAGTLPLLVPALGRTIANDDLLDSIDGLLLTGSPSNVLPRHYAEPPSRPGTLHDPHRDETTPAARAPLHRARDASARGMPGLPGGERRVRRDPAPARPRAARDAGSPQARGARHRRAVRTGTPGRPGRRRHAASTRPPAGIRGQLASLARASPGSATDSQSRRGRRTGSSRR